VEELTVRNLNSAATNRQLWYLHQLTGDDTRDWKLTKQQASDKIAELEAGQLTLKPQSQNIINGSAWRPVPLEWENFLKTPMTYADVRLFFGDQGQGKSITAVASAIDDYYLYLTHVVSPG